MSLDSEQAAAALDASGLPLPERARAAEVVRAAADLASQRGGLANPEGPGPTRSTHSRQVPSYHGEEPRRVLDTTGHNLDRAAQVRIREWAVDEALRTSLVAVDTSVARLRQGPAGNDATSTPTPTSHPRDISRREHRPRMASGC